MEATSGEITQVERTWPHDAEAIARVCHEANSAYCASIGEAPSLSWDNAADWQRQSAIAGVEAVRDGTARSPEEQHQAWCEHKLAEGWKYGPVKDPQAKEHPCLVPYAELPDAQKRKDFLFRAVVQALTCDL